MRKGQKDFGAHLLEVCGWQELVAHTSMWIQRAFSISSSLCRLENLARMLPPRAVEALTVEEIDDPDACCLLMPVVAGAPPATATAITTATDEVTTSTARRTTSCMSTSTCVCKLRVRCCRLYGGATTFRSKSPKQSSRLESLDEPCRRD